MVYTVVAVSVVISPGSIVSLPTVYENPGKINCDNGFRMKRMHRFLRDIAAVF